MVKVSFQTSDFERRVADAPSMILKNRYYEKVDSASEDGAALIARPGMRRLTSIGDGPIRGLGSESGSFGGDLFVASGTEIYRMDNQLNATSLYTNLADGIGPVRIAITGVIGTTPAYAFIADGSNLFVYMEDGFAHNSLSGSPADSDLLQIGDYYYKWTSGNVDEDGKARGYFLFGAQPANNDTISVDGTTLTFKTSATSGTHIAIGSDVSETISNAVSVINSNLSTVSASKDTNDDKINIVAATSGTAGNSITIAESSSAITVSGSTLSGGSTTQEPDGSASYPWLVAFGATDALSFSYMYYAINASGEAGTDYSTDLDANPDVQATAYSTTYLAVKAGTAGSDYNGIVTTEDGASLAWENPGSLAGGGEPWFGQVMMPADGMGAIDVAVINSFVIVIPSQTNGFQGQFYYIEPGEIVINSLNYFTAERSPDAVYGVQVCGDAFWLPGETTTEVWYVNNNTTTDNETAAAGAQMLRYQGIMVDRGGWENTSKAIHESMVIVDADGGVFTVSGGSPTRISTPTIEEQIRKAINAQKASLY